MSYPFKSIENYWQNYWKDNNTFTFNKNDKKTKAYILEMLPYPSGNLHMGHVRNYTLGDAMARFKRANGFNVFHPMGWDSFGLPAENAAIQNKRHPKDWTNKNIAHMKEQLNSLGFSYSWDNELSTCDKDYYGLEQEIFLDMYNKGLIYQKESWVNWDPEENSVLANEQVVDGKGWRSGATIERRLLKQWFVKITDYAQELLDSLDELKGWPEKVVKMQENWIGKSSGAIVKFKLENLDDYLEVYTSTPEVLFGASFCAIASSHPFIKKYFENDLSVKEFIKECDKIGTTEESIATADKKGLKLPINVINPITNEVLPLYIANFVLMEFGTGAIYGCPAHDERDFDFAKKYNLSIKQVLQCDNNNLEVPFYSTDAKIINSSSSKIDLNSLRVKNAKVKIIDFLTDNNFGYEKVQFRLRDWLVSRQRYWGCPIPVIHCDNCGTIPLDKNLLPVLLPDDVDFSKTGNPLENHPTWKNTTCHKCNAKAIKETDTLDTFFESSWYYMRYLCNQSNQVIDKNIVNQYMPVDQYIGGIEHAVLHLLYSRFFTKSLRDMGYVNFNEPFSNLMTQGMVCHPTYKSTIDNNWLYPYEVEKHNNTYIKSSDKTPVLVGRQEKMSKSKKNTIDPKEIIFGFGADSARFFILSDTPADKDFDWNDDGLDGSWRYLSKLHKIATNIDCCNNTDNTKDLDIIKITHQYIASITRYYNNYAFNKVISLIRELSKKIEDHFITTSKTTLIQCFNSLIQMLNPIAPHVSHEMYKIINKKEVVVDDLNWPTFNEQYLINDTANIAVQINGKLRADIILPVDTPDELVITEVLKLTNVKKHLEGKVIKKHIVVKNKIVNIVAI